MRGKHQAKLKIISKKARKSFGCIRNFSYLCTAFKNNAWRIGYNPSLEGWVSGCNQQFAKLPCEFSYRGFESPSFRTQSFKRMQANWSVHLTVRIQDSQSWHTSSILVPTTIESCKSQICGTFCFKKVRIWSQSKKYFE